MLWVKAFHLFFVVSWFAGLLYLPRLFVYHATTEDQAGRSRFSIMEKRLFVIMTIGAAGSAARGGDLLYAYGWDAYAAVGWLDVKITLIGILIGYHIYCYRVILAFARNEERHTALYFRWMNELPALILLAVLVLTVVKPF